MSRGQAHLLVGIGASAGGLEALERFFHTVPMNTGLSFAIVQHLSPDFKSMMSELLARHTDLPIYTADQGLIVEPNAVYLIPARKEMRISDGRLHLVDKDVRAGFVSPINIFFESMAEDFGSRSIGIVLSGTGSDGSAGIKAIHREGGFVISQSPETAKFDSMPNAAIETGAVDLVLPPEAMAQAIVEYSRNPEGFDPQSFTAPQRDVEGEPEGLILAQLRRTYGTDFRHYKPATVNRRIQRRIGMGSCESVAAYAQLLQEDSSELNQLYRDLLIGVTKFFRDRDSFDLLASRVVPPLVSRMAADTEIRVWCTGCASGEEAYSLAILFFEEARLQRKNIRLKIFATDLHADSIVEAGRGVYGPQAVTEIPEDLLERYFTRGQGMYQVSPELRKHLVFTRHDVVKDPPFTKIDLLTCRNMLIYFQHEVQHQVLSAFHFALVQSGTLFLGPSETLGELSHAFDPIDHHWKIFRRKSGVHLPRVTPQLRPLDANGRAAGYAAGPAQKIDQALIRAYDAVLERYIPGGFLIDEHRNLVHCFADGDRHLRQRRGRYTSDLLEMLEDDVRVAVATAIQRSRREHKAILFNGLTLSRDTESNEQLSIWVEPLGEKGRQYTLIVLESQEARNLWDATEVDSIDLDEVSRQRVKSLEVELRYTKENLQATIEELETSNEELQSTNEEMVASNEELQSTNEELHSVNEELYTVNSEYQQKIEELTQLTNDMENLLASTEIGTIFLDEDLRIRKFTTAAREAFNLLPSDVGRSIEHFSFSLDTPEVLEGIHTVLETAEGIEREVRRNSTGESFLLKILPYRLVDGAMEGVVLTFVDIATLKAAQKQVAERQRELELFTATVAHDLKAPLRRVSQSIRIIEESLGTGKFEEAHEFLALTNKAAIKMSNLIDDLLSYSRMEQVESRIERVELREVVAVARTRNADLIERSQAQVLLEGEPSPVFSDRIGLGHILSNLVSNAISYSREGVRPEVRIYGRELDDTYELRVRDNGIGVSRQSRETIFAPFRRGEGSESCEGSGFGLAICKKITQRLGGDIRIESTGPDGSTFLVTLPSRASSATDETNRQSPSHSIDPHSIRIAHLDDEPIESSVLSRYLGKVPLPNLEYTYFQTPRTFFESVRQDQFDVAFVDYDLKSELNGIDVLRRLRGDGYSSPAFLISGLANDSIEEEFRSLGGTDVLNKAELSPDTLHELIKKYLARAPEEGVEAPANAPSGEG